jgi:hypothetical protein
VKRITRPATGSVASVKLAKSTTGVEPANFDQSLPFHNHVTARGARLVPQTTEGLPVVVPFVVPFALAVAPGDGARSGIVALDGTPVFEVDDPDDPELDDPEPEEQAIGWFVRAGSSVPTRTTSWVAGS